MMSLFFQQADTKMLTLRLVRARACDSNLQRAQRTKCAKILKIDSAGGGRARSSWTNDSVDTWVSLAVVHTPVLHQ